MKRHIHEAGDGDEIDACKKCGRDLRDPIHLRSLELAPRCDFRDGHRQCKREAGHYGAHLP